MRFTELKVMERKNKGNYEHLEITVTAVIEESEDHYASMNKLRLFVKESLNSEVVVPPPVPKQEAEVIAPVEVKKEEEVKPKETKAKKEKVEKPKAEKKVNLVKYSSEVPEHKSILSGFLSGTYGDSWKSAAPVADIKAFTASLNGEEYLNEDGSICASFVSKLKGFFG